MFLDTKIIGNIGEIYELMGPSQAYCYWENCINSISAMLIH